MKEKDVNKPEKEKKLKKKGMQKKNCNCYNVVFCAYVFKS